ncbi:kinase-like domain-containing protein [Phlyctochytrium arcticum]|nr:kinase-like domain-containing protein [Phlyctochytrium arcticum]
MVNGLLTKDKRASRRALCARSYPVIPFGQRFGMIKWVEDVVPLFSVYKRWQFHDHAYYRKLSAALQRHGLSRKTPRREWPVAVLVDVFHSLKGETPSDLLRKEFLCRSSDSRDWWERTKAFARSSAVMSVVGYVIGLGDRHLDNILIDSKTGEVVHIDYNVCFENGRKLRIPETVPFRLTGIIRDAFGPYGTAGEFRTACEIVLKAMRTKSAEFLILLEAFVYDPLVDWVKKPLIDSEAQLPMITVSNLSHGMAFCRCQFFAVTLKPSFDRK